MAPDTPGTRATTRPAFRSDLLWIAALALAALAYFVVLIAFDTTFFFAQGGAAVTVDQVVITAGLLVAQTLTVPLRHRHPLVMFTAVVVLLLAAEVVSGDRNLVVNLTLLFAVWTLTGGVRVRWWLTALAAAIVVDVAVQLVLFAQYGPIVVATVFVVVLRTVVSFGIAVPAGLFARSLRRSARLSAEVAAALEGEHAARVAAALALERTRMARELHDVAAYHLSGIVLQAAAVKEVIGTDPETAAALADSIRDESELTVQSLREVIGVLRTDDGPAGSASITQLPALLEQLRTGHPGVGFTTAGDLADVPPATALAVFRIAQESVTNAVKHSPGAAIEILVERDLTAVTVEVRNAAATETVDPPLSGGGFGLVGMRERANILGGELVAGPLDDGWRTRAVIPLSTGVPR